MIIAFEFKMACFSADFCYLLSKISENIEHKITQNGEYITLFASGSDDEISSFSTTLSQNLPHSIFLQDTRVFLAENLPQNSLNISNPKTKAITPSVINAYKNGKIIKNEFGVLSEIFIFNEAVNELNFHELLKRAVDEFMTKNELKMADKNGEFLVLNSKNAKTIVPTNLKNLPKMFIATEQEQVALASFEKPTILLKTTALFRQNHDDAQKFYSVKAPKDLFFYAFCDELFKRGVSFVGLENFSDTNEAMILEKNILFSQKNEFLDKKSLVLEFKKSGDDSVNFKGVELLFVPKFGSFDEIFTLIKELPSGEQFMQNFTKTYEISNQNLNLPASFFSLFCIVGVLIGLSDEPKRAGEILLLNALDFSVKKGVSIECGRSKNEFNALKFIKSAMSFYLAGAGVHNISFGCVQSLALFFSDFCYDYGRELGFDSISFCGDLFKSKVVSELFLKHLEPNFNTAFGDFIKI